MRPCCTRWRVGAALGMFCVLGAGVRPMAAQRSSQMQAALPMPANAPHFRVTAAPSTVQIGKPSRISVQLADARGARITASSTVQLLVTVTTQPTLLQAKKTTSPLAGTPVTLANQKLTLPAPQDTVQVRALFPNGMTSVDCSLTLNRLGDVRVFVESVGGLQVQPGSALISGVTADLLRNRREEDPPAVLRAAWQPGASADGIYLRFKDSGLDVVRQGRELVRPFYVGLESIEGGLSHPALPPGRANLTVDLEIRSGHGRFDKQSLVIPADSMNSNDAAEMRSSVGGTIEMAARSVRREIHEAQGSFTFEPGFRATKLKVTPLSDSAFANGLNPIPIEVSAIFDEGTTRQTIITAEAEGLPRRDVSLKFTGGSARLKDGATSFTIPAGDTSKTVEVFASRPGAVVVEARSSNALKEAITGSNTANFRLPWWQLATAALGGLLVPVILRLGWTRLLLGTLGGAVLYVLLLFGAVLTGELNLGRVAIALTKLPTENVLASFVLGLLGYLVLSPVLRVAAPRRS